jgi:hypothetical protein
LLTSKAVPLHAMEARGGRGGIAPTHSRPRHYMGWVVSVTPRPRFYPRGTEPRTHWIGGWVGPRAGLGTEVRGNIFCLCRGSNLDRPVFQSVARHYTDWATRLPYNLLGMHNLYWTKIRAWLHVLYVHIWTVHADLTQGEVVWLYMHSLDPICISETRSEIPYEIICRTRGNSAFIRK